MLTALVQSTLNLHISKQTGYFSLLMLIYLVK